MADRQIIVVDTETTGLTRNHIAIEVAWWNLDTDERGHFYPWWPLRDIAIEQADPKALELNGFYDRIKPVWDHYGKTLDSEAQWYRESNWSWAKLRDQLTGNILAGSNPSFDARHLVHNLGEPVWHHRMLDLANYAAGVLGFEPNNLPGLATVAARLGVHPGDHTAEADVTATGKCIAILRQMAYMTQGRPEVNGTF